MTDSTLGGPTSSPAGKPMVTVYCEPHMARWLDDEVRDNSVVLVDLEPDVVKESLRLDINAVFSAVPVRVRNTDHYVAAPGGRVRLSLQTGTIADFTKSIQLTVNYANTETSTRQHTVRIAPAVRVELGGAAVEGSGLEDELRRGTRVERSCTFAGYEGALIAKELPRRAVQWDLRETRGLKAVADYADGNLYLFARAKWERGQVEGYVEVVPHRVAFYGPDRKEASILKSAMVLYALWRRGIEIGHLDGVKVEFWSDR